MSKVPAKAGAKKPAEAPAAATKSPARKAPEPFPAESGAKTGTARPTSGGPKRPAGFDTEGDTAKKTSASTSKSPARPTSGGPKKPAGFAADPAPSAGDGSTATRKPSLTSNALVTQQQQFRTFAGDDDTPDDGGSSSGVAPSPIPERVASVTPSLGQGSHVAPSSLGGGKRVVASSVSTGQPRKGSVVQESPQSSNVSPGQRRSSVAQRETPQSLVSPTVSEARRSSASRTRNSFSDDQQSPNSVNETPDSMNGRRQSIGAVMALISGRRESYNPPPRDLQEFGEELALKPWPAILASRPFLLVGPTIAVEDGVLKEVIPKKLYRIVVHKGIDERWYFYNDSTDYEFSVALTFGAGSSIKLGIAQEKEIKECAASMKGDTKSGQTVSFTVFPGRTVCAAAGNPQGCSTAFKGTALSDGYFQRMAAEAEVSNQLEMTAVRELCAKAATKDEDVLAACLRVGMKFVDMSFPPLCGQSLHRQGIDSVPVKPFPFKRPCQFLSLVGSAESDASDNSVGINGRLFCGNVFRSSVNQGQLGDCWLLAAIASLAEFPDKIRDIFRHPVEAKIGQRERQVGGYRVTLNCNGWWRIVVVDDFLPTSVAKPAFGSSTADPRELWVALLEKAYAKVKGSYASIVGGDSLEALQDLTGFPVTRFDAFDDPTKTDQDLLPVIKNLHRLDKGNSLVVLNTPSYNPDMPNQEQTFDDAGLSLGHVYSVIKTVFVERLGLYLVNVRNPWGDGMEWKGDWSDDSLLWDEHPDVRTLVEFVNHPSDCQFWMSWHDIRRYFCGGGVCFVRMGWHDYRVAGDFEVGGVPTLALEIRSSKAIKVMLTLSQTDDRQKNAKGDALPYAAILLAVTKTRSGTGSAANHSLQEVHMSTTHDTEFPSTGKYQYNYARDVGMAYTLEAACTHYVVPRVHEVDVSRPYVLGLISSAPVGSSLQVRFVKLGPDTGVFKNMKVFLVDKMDEVTAKWQYNPDFGGPKDGLGTLLRDQAAMKA